MAGMNAPKPTEAELAILNVLWSRGPSTVREVHEALKDERSCGYTTVLKFLQIMHAKGLVVRNDDERAHVYRPSQSQEAAQKTLVTDLVDRLFNGSTKSLVMHAISSKKSSPEEIAEIRNLLDSLEEERK